LGSDVALQDMKGESRVFKHIAVIHHRGKVIGNTTRGHYMADVLGAPRSRRFTKI